MLMINADREQSYGWTVVEKNQPSTTGLWIEYHSNDKENFYTISMIFENGQSSVISYLVHNSSFVSRIEGNPHG